MAFDLIIIGGGPAGYVAGERAAHAGLKTLLIEKEHIGGVCLNEGCIPTKTLLHSTKIKDAIDDGKKYGVYAENIHMDHKAVLNRKSAVIKKLTSGIRMSLKAAGVQIVESSAVITGKSTLGFEVSAGENVYTAGKLLLASGSVSLIPPIDGLREGLDSGFVLPSKEILELAEVPKKLAVIGGGVIGMELASYFQSAGTQVTVIEMMDTIGGPIDDDIAEILKKNCQKKGLFFHLGAKVTNIGEDTLTFEKSGISSALKADNVLLSVGRVPYTENLGLEKVGVEINNRAVITDEHMQTNVSGIYAAGDITGKVMLAHAAYREAEVAVNNMLGIDDVMNYDTIPSVIYTDPEVAGTGDTEKTASEKGINMLVKKISMNYSGRYVAENDQGDGIIKIIMNKDNRRIVGLNMIGKYASEIIYGANILIEKGFTVEQIKKMIFPHPTNSEIIREAIFKI